MIRTGRAAAPLPIHEPEHTILVVDDEPGIVSALAFLLQRSGYTVDTADNGRVALQQLQARLYDHLILCDLRMPELDGPRFYRALEESYPHLRRRVIFLTGDTLSPEARAFLDTVGVPCLSKPFGAVEVRQVVQQALQVLREVCLAHHRDLFCAELPECKRHVWEAFWQSAEDSVVTIARVSVLMMSPARLPLVGAINSYC
jgi:CheY-like chemotaxis protein